MHIFQIENIFFKNNMNSKETKEVKDEMENAVCLDVNLDVDLNIGDSWYDTK